MFRHGVASGDPLPRAVVLWTRVTPTAAAVPGSGRGPRVSVRWEVASDQHFRHVVRHGQVVTGPGRDHTVKVDATRLQPGRWYWYRFRVGGVTSPVGRTRTAPPRTADVRRLRLGVVSCSHLEYGYFAAYRHLADRRDLDAVLHLGDYLYERGPGEGDVRSHDPAHEIVSLPDYRRRHAQYKTDPDLQRLHARVPFIVTWDDHEVTNDSWAAGAENHDAGEGDYLARKARAHRAYDEWMPVRMGRTARTGDGTRLFRRLQWGRLADINMLDLRSYRDQQVSTPAPFPLPQLQTEADDPGRTITGNQQMAWLKRALLRRDTRWKLIGNSVMIAPLSFAQLPQEAVAAINEVTGEIPSDGAPLNLDQWDGYTADRRELYAHLVDNRVANAVFLTGDIHSAWANDLPVDPATYPFSGSVGVEFVCTSVTSDNIDDVTGTPPRTSTLVLEAVLQTNNRHVKHLNFDDHGYSVLDVTPDRAQMDYYVLADKRRADSAAHCSASWLTRSGSQRVEPAEAPVG
ncbi:MAG: alkaline phosphatase D family protein [Nocardioides sp.]|nr:alkaline phosphatase D family protein [Nocardioides sp.]